MGKLAKPHMGAVGFSSQTAAKQSGWVLGGAVEDALRASFQPVVDEPIPDRLQKMIDMLRIEEQEKRGSKP